MDFSRDPVINAIYKGIKEGIKVALENKCYGSSLILIFAGIDAMANLARPESSKEVKQADFIGWVNKYLKIETKESITGEEFYGARCAVLHTYGIESGLTKKRIARKLGYMVHGDPPIKYNADVDKALVIVDILALSEAFFNGIDNFLIDLFASMENKPMKRKIVEDRLNKLIVAFPINGKI